MSVVDRKKYCSQHLVNSGEDKHLPIRSNDDGEREAERDDLLFFVGAEGPNSADGQLVDRGHLLGVLSAPPTLVVKSVI